MEWLALAVWLIIVAIALPLGLGAILGRISLGIQALAALGAPPLEHHATGARAPARGR